MAISRESITSIYEKLWRCINSADWEEWLEYFAHDCTFTNSAMNDVIEGKNRLRELAKSFPRVVNTPEWYAIDGQRLIVSWKERPPHAAENLAYRGVSSFCFDNEGKILDYVGTFNMQDVIKAFSS